MWIRLGQSRRVLVSPAMAAAAVTAMAGFMELATAATAAGAGLWVRRLSCAPPPASPWRLCFRYMPRHHGSSYAYAAYTPRSHHQRQLDASAHGQRYSSILQ